MFIYLFCFVFCFFVFLFVFLREREIESKQGRDRDRIPSRLRAVSTGPDVGLEPMNHEIMTWAEMKSRMLNQLSHPGAPICLEFTFLGWNFSCFPSWWAFFYIELEELLKTKGTCVVHLSLYFKKEDDSNTRTCLSLSSCLCVSKY